MTTRAAFVAEQIKARREGRVLCPVVRPFTFEPYPVTFAYREPGDYQLGYHTGEDHACPQGSLAVAVSWGEVVHAGPAGSYGAAYGLLVVVRNQRGDLDGLWCHLARVDVEVGDHVTPGTQLGLTGATGHVTGAHLHFEVRPAGGRYGSDVRPILLKRKPTTRPTLARSITEGS